MPSQRPHVPTPELIEEKIRRFDASGAGISDKALTDLFTAFPNNVQYEHVLLKAISLNALYYTNIKAIYMVATHVWQCDIDFRLAAKSPEVVNEIARTRMKDGKIRWNYSFASKYCSWHQPDAYPIYDGYVDSLIWAYQKHDKFSKFRRGDLFADYCQYKRVLEAFREYYGLTEFSFKELDKFLWVYGKEYFGARW